MQATIEAISTQQIRQRLTVKPEHLDDKGELATCIILKEIMNLNDQVVMRTLGAMDYYKFFTTWHRVELMNATARGGDQIELIAEFYFTQQVSLEISVTVRKNEKYKSVLMAKGYFSFTMNNGIDKSVYLW